MVKTGVDMVLGPWVKWVSSSYAVSILILAQWLTCCKHAQVLLCHCQVIATVFKSLLEEQMFDVAVQTLLEMPTSHIRVRGSKSWLCSLFQLPAHEHPARQRWWLRSLGPWHPDWVPGSWRRRGSSLSIVGICWINMGVRDLSLSFCLAKKKKN